MSAIPQISRSSNSGKFSSFLTNVNRKTKKRIDKYDILASKVKECDSNPKCSKTQIKNAITKKKVYTRTNTKTQKKNREEKVNQLLKVLFRLSKYYKKKLKKTLDNITSKSIFGNYKKIEEKDINDIKKYITILIDIYTQTECKATSKIKSNIELETLLVQNKYSTQFSKPILDNILSNKPDMTFLQSNMEFFITLKNIVDKLDTCSST